jgi:hypothetical protein
MTYLLGVRGGEITVVLLRGGRRPAGLPQSATGLLGADTVENGRHGS